MRNSPNIPADSYKTSSATNIIQAFPFAYAVFHLLGIVNLPLGIPGGILPIFVNLAVVQGNIPALLVLDVLDEHSLTPNTVTKYL